MVFKAYDEVLTDCMKYSHLEPRRGDFAYEGDELLWTYRDAALYISLVPESQVLLRVSYVKAMLEGFAWFIEETYGRVTSAHFTLAESGREVCDGAWNIEANGRSSSVSKERSGTDQRQKNASSERNAS